MKTIEIIINTLVENGTDAAETNIGKVFLAISLIAIFSFITLGLISFGVYTTSVSITMGILFIIPGVALLSIYSYRFIKNYQKK